MRHFDHQVSTQMIKIVDNPLWAWDFKCKTSELLGQELPPGSEGSEHTAPGGIN